MGWGNISQFLLLLCSPMIAFSIGSLHIYRYGIMYMLSFMTGYLTLIWGQKQYPLIDELLNKNIDELILSIMIGVMVGGRLGHVFIYDFAYFVAHPLKVFAIQEGGMSFIGGIVGTILSVGIYYTLSISNCKLSIRGVLSLLDAFIPLVPVGIFFGRFGNFLNQELYGTVVPADFRGLPSWFVKICQTTQFFYIYPHIGSSLRINTNFLSMVFEGAILALILRFCFFRFRVVKTWNFGQLSAVFLGGYSCIRFVLEYLRQDSQAEFVGRYTKSQWFFLVFIVVAIAVFVSQQYAISKKMNQ